MTAAKVLQRAAGRETGMLRYKGQYRIKERWRHGAVVGRYPAINGCNQSTYLQIVSEGQPAAIGRG